MSSLDTVKTLASMKKASSEIWEETVKNHESEIDEMLKALTTVYSWVKVLDARQDSSILVKEALLDLFASVNSILNGYYRQGMFSLRSCLELILEFVYYTDHQIEYKRWRKAGGTDVESKLGKWLEEGLLGEEYIAFFVPEKNVKGELNVKARKVYGSLSKFIHAQKEDVMQIDKHSMKMTYDLGRFARSKSNFIEVVGMCNVALCIRFWDDFLNASELRQDTLYLIEQYKDVIEL